MPIYTPNLLAADIGGAQEPDPFTLNTQQNVEQASEVSARQTEDVIQNKLGEPVRQQATPSEQAAPASTPLDAETTQSANYVTKSFNDFIARGGDLTKLSKDDLDAVVSGAEILPPIEHPETDPARMYALYRKGQFKPATVSTALIGDALNGLVSMGKAGTQAIGELLTTTPLAIPFVGYNSFVESKQKQGTALVMSARQGIDNTINLLPHGFMDVLAATGIKNEQDANTDPDKGAQLDVKQSEIIRQRMLRETAAQKNTTDLRDGIADVYKSIGQNSAATAIASVDPNSPMVQTMGLLTDPINLLSFGAEGLMGKVATRTLRAGVRTQRMAETGVVVSELDDRLAATALARAQTESALTSKTPMTALSRTGMENNLSRLKVVESNLQTQHAAATAEHAAAMTEVNDQLTRMAKGDPYAGNAAKLVQAGGQVAGLVGKVQDAFDLAPELLARKILPGGSEAQQAALTEALRAAVNAGVGGAVGMLHGGPLGAAVGGVANPLLSLLGKGTWTKAAHNLSAIGEQMAAGQATIPFMRAVADKTTGLTSIVASKLDNASIAPLIYAAPHMIKSTAVGAGIGGVAGYFQSGGDPRGAAQGIATGGLFGMAGGLSQLGHYNSPAELRQARIVDRGRFTKTLSTEDNKLFNRLNPDYQLAIGTYAIAHPDLDVHFFADKKGSNGNWQASAPKGVVNVNVLGDNPMHAILAHEIGHHIAAHELGDQVDAYTRGDPLTGRAGLTTQLDANGNPMTQIDAEGNQTFVQNAQFERYKANYNARLLKDNPGHPPAGDYTIAQEIFADLHAHSIENPGALQKMVRGHVPSDIVSESMLNNFLQKTGFGTDAITGNPIATSNLEGAKGLRDVIEHYYKQRQYKSQDITDFSDRADNRIRTDTKIPVGDIVKGTEEFDRLTKNLGDTGDLVRNADGSIKVDDAGRPIVKTPQQANADHAKLAQDVIDIYKHQPGLTEPNNPNALKLVQDRNGRWVYRGQHTPDAVFDTVTASNQHNANQILNWRKMDALTRLDAGTATNGVYNTATKGKGRYATLAARERVMVPLYTEISPKTGQVNIQMYDPEQMVKNVTKMMKTKKGKELWDSVGTAYDDVRTYLDNLVNNQPGETGIGLEKKGIINELFGINTQGNPLIDSITNRPSQSVWKTMRIDRMNRVEAIRDSRAVRADTYEKVRSFMQPRGNAHLHNADLPQPQTIEEARGLPSGTHFLDPKGKRRKRS